MSTIRTPGMAALTHLVKLRTAGGFTLPDEVQAAYDAHQQMQAAETPEPDGYHVQNAAQDLLAAIIVGTGDDLTTVSRRVQQADTQRQLHEVAGRVRSTAIELAADNAVTIAGDATETIITDHLRPVLERLHEQAHEAAVILRPHGLDPAVLLTAPAKARNAYGQLHQLAEQRQVIFTARRYANGVGFRQPQHDEAHQFAEFEEPMALHPTWQPETRLPPLPAPEDPLRRLLWVVTDATPGKPWLPTIAEQDAAWWSHFGEGTEMRRQAQRNAQAVGARIG